MEEDNKNTLKVIEEIINDPKTSPELSYTVYKFINNGFSKTSNSVNFSNSGNNNEKTSISGDENLSQVFSNKLTQGQYIKLKDVIFS